MITENVEQNVDTDSSKKISDPSKRHWILFDRSQCLVNYIARCAGIPLKYFTHLFVDAFKLLPKNFEMQLLQHISLDVFYPKDRGSKLREHYENASDIPEPNINLWCDCCKQWIFKSNAAVRHGCGYNVEGGIFVPSLPLSDMREYLINILLRHYDVHFDMEGNDKKELTVCALFPSVEHYFQAERSLDELLGDTSYGV